MGGGGSSSKKEETIKTTTTTNIRDVGFTGAQATDLAKTIQKGAIQSEKIRASSLEKISQEQGDQFNQLVGGAGQLVKSAGKAATTLAGTAQDVTEAAKTTASQQLGTAEQVARGVAPGADTESNFDRFLPLIVVGLALVPLIVRSSR